jgi:hypothetical protein
MQSSKPRTLVAATHRQDAGGEVPVNWCIEADTLHNVIARRNALVALWAGRKMGLSEAEMTRYAGAVHFSDYQVVGDADIVGKVRDDLQAHGIEIGEADVRRKLAEFHKEALRQSHATD